MTLDATAGQHNAGAGNKLATVQPGVRSSQPLGANGVGIGVLRHVDNGLWRSMRGRFGSISGNCAGLRQATAEGSSRPISDVRRDHLIGRQLDLPPTCATCSGTDMKSLSPSDCSTWLKYEECIEAPYGKAGLGHTSYLQFAVPENDGAASVIVDGVRSYLEPPRTCLLQVTDWSRHGELENSLLEEMESTCSGKLNPWDGFGQLFEASEADDVLGCCATVLRCGMSAYIYIPLRATFLLWEGDLVDLWASASVARNQFLQRLRSEGVRITSS